MKAFFGGGTAKAPWEGGVRCKPAKQRRSDTPPPRCHLSMGEPEAGKPAQHSSPGTAGNSLHTAPAPPPQPGWTSAPAPGLGPGCSLGPITALHSPLSTIQSQEPPVPGLCKCLSSLEARVAAQSGAARAVPVRHTVTVPFSVPGRCRANLNKVVAQRIGDTAAEGRDLEAGVGA